MTIIWRYFPTILAVTFICAGSHFGPVQQVGGLLRWLVLAVGFMLAFKRTSSPQTRQFQLFDAAFLALITICFLSSLWSISPSYTFQRSISVLLLYGTCLWTLWKWADEMGDRQLISQIVNAVGGILCANTILGLSILPGSFLVGRFRGFLENPNTVAILCGLYLPFLFYYVLKEPSRIKIALFAFATLGLLLSGGRAGIAAAFASCAVVLWISRSKRKHAQIVLSVFFVIAGYLWKADQIDAYVQTKVLRHKSGNVLSNREVAWRLSSKYIANKPNLGHGFGTDNGIHKFYGKKLRVRVHDAASSYYGLSIQFGRYIPFVFLSLLGLFIIQCMIQGLKGNEMLIVTAMVLANGLLIGITEPWLSSAGNPFSWFYWTIAMLSMRELRGVKSRDHSAVMQIYGYSFQVPFGSWTHTS